MNVSFRGNMYFLPNQYSIRKEGADKSQTVETKDDLVVNTDHVAYMTHRFCQRGAEFHMDNGYVITAKAPFNDRIYDIAKELPSNKTIGYNADDSISIETTDVEKLKKTFNVKEGN